MRLTFPLTPQAAAAVERCAAEMGVDPATFVLHALREKLAEREESHAEKLSDEQWRSEFRRWLASHRSRNPRRNDSRESLYC